jgi:hypothetical protein
MDIELYEAFVEDHRDRKQWKEWGKSIPLEDIQERDKRHLKLALEKINSNSLKDEKDFYHAAVILQHSELPEHFKLASELCKKAVELGEERAKLFYAKTLDRYLLSIGEPFQKFGTQYEKDSAGMWQLCPVDPTTTDEERAEFNVPTLKESLDKATELNS